MTVRYNRTPSPGFLDLFRTGNLLSPLCRPSLQWQAQDGSAVGLDLQFRERDEAALYCGLTKLVVVANSRGGVRVSANRAYKKQGTTAKYLFRIWRLMETASDFQAALDAYLADVRVARQWYATEGLVQARWLGNESGTKAMPPWHPIDREAVLGYTDMEESRAVLKRNAFRKACSVIEQLRDVEHWANVEIKTTQELDQIAVTDNGSELVLIEVKPFSASKVYYAPFQLFRYVVAWHAALSSSDGKNIVAGVNGLIRAKEDVDLMPQRTPRFREKISNLALRPVVVIDTVDRHDFSDEVWSRLIRVFRSLPWAELLPHPRVLEPQLWGWAAGESPQRLIP